MSDFIGLRMESKLRSDEIGLSTESEVSGTMSPESSAWFDKYSFLYRKDIGLSWESRGASPGVYPESAEGGTKGRGIWGYPPVYSVPLSH
jgi:hypothetical protein